MLFSAAKSRVLKTHRATETKIVEAAEKKMEWLTKLISCDAHSVLVHGGSCTTKS